MKTTNSSSVANKCLYCYSELNEEIDFHEKCSFSFFGSKQAPQLAYTLEQMTDLAKDIIERHVSIPGVQAKLSMSIISDTVGQTKTRLTVVGALGGNYIFKPPSKDFLEMTQNEHVTMKIAESFGIKVVPSSLIRLQSGELSYITKRIDRNEDGTKNHMLDMFQITEAFDKYKSSNEKIGKALQLYSDNTFLDKILFYEMIIFCFLTGNNDMHLKNFSMIKGVLGWTLSPAYDLLNVVILNPTDKEELALTLGGKKQKLKKLDFIQFGIELGMTNKQIDSVFKRFENNKIKAFNWIDESFLSDEMKNNYKSLMEKRYVRFVL